MENDDNAAIVETCRQTYAETHSMDAAYTAAEAVYRELHPDETDWMTVRAMVAISVNKAQFASHGSFWDEPSRSPAARVARNRAGFRRLSKAYTKRTKTLRKRSGLIFARCCWRAMRFCMWSD